MGAHTCNSHTGETEAGRPQIWGWPGIYSKPTRNSLRESEGERERNSILSFGFPTFVLRFIFVCMIVLRTCM